MELYHNLRCIISFARNAYRCVRLGRYSIQMSVPSEGSSRCIGFYHNMEYVVSACRGGFRMRVEQLFLLFISISAFRNFLVFAVHAVKPSLVPDFLRFGIDCIRIFDPCSAFAYNSCYDKLLYKDRFISDCDSLPVFCLVDLLSVYQFLYYFA